MGCLCVKDTVKVAAVQLWIKSELKSEREGNINRAISLMEEAVALEADFICLPEYRRYLPRQQREFSWDTPS